MTRRGILFIVMALVVALASAGVASATEIYFKEPAGGFPATFTSKDASASVLETLGGQRTTCTSLTDNGTIESSHSGTMEIMYKGCSTEAFGIKLQCRTSGAAEKEVVVKGVTFDLGFTPEGGETKRPALLMEPPGGKFEFSCTSLAKMVVTGQVIGLFNRPSGGPVEPDVPYESAIVAFSQTGGKQSKTTFEKFPADEILEGQHLNASLNGEAAEEAGLSSEDTWETFESGGKATPVEVEVTPVFMAAKGVSYTVKYEAEQEGAHTFSVGSETISCAEASFKGNLKEASGTTSVMPVFNNCVRDPAGADEPTEILTNKCELTFNGLVRSGSVFDGQIAVKNGGIAPCIKIAFESSRCEVLIEPQGPKSGVEFENTTGPEGLKITLDTTLSYTMQNESSCPEGIKAGSSFTYAGKSKEPFKEGAEAIVIK